MACIGIQCFAKTSLKPKMGGGQHDGIKKLYGLSTQVNYTDRVTTAYTYFFPKRRKKVNKSGQYKKSVSKQTPFLYLQIISL
jgi:hypothetical protein